MLKKERNDKLQVDQSEIFNQVHISGIIESECEFDHEWCGEKFYKTRVIAKRFSGKEDYIPVIISEKIVKIHALQKGVQVNIKGQFRSYNKKIDNRTKLLLNVFVDSIEIVQDVVFLEKDLIYLDGYICKEPKLRNTPSSGRQLADVLLAVNRRYGKSDYIPCIMWSRNAIFVSQCNVGDRLRVYGRIQSRKYPKKNPESNEVEIKEAYEISVQTIEKIL